MNEEDLLKAIEDLFNNYDAFLIDNKYLNRNTHQKQFEMLENRFKNDEMSMRAINWIKHRYDCYYKEEFKDDNSAFAYLRKQLEG